METKKTTKKKAKKKAKNKYIDIDAVLNDNIPQWQKWAMISEALCKHIAEFVGGPTELIIGSAQLLNDMVNAARKTSDISMKYRNTDNVKSIQVDYKGGQMHDMIEECNLRQTG